ncbi:hypothetical protein ACQ4PT_031253 [Festuca glaucescens]
MEQPGDKTRLLPDDVLAAVLGRLAPRDLAVCRCACKAWLAIIDARRILRAELLPHTLAGIFINFNELKYSEFFCRPPPSEGLGVRERLVYHHAMDHCNGLLLQYNYVANPATGWEAPLPPRPPPSLGMECFPDEAYLVFDPAVSPHYQVFLIPQVPYIELDIEPFEEPDIEIDPTILESEWPPSLCPLRVFSSLTGRWEERQFLREGEAAGTVAHLATDDYLEDKRHGVYWRGALYVHCANSFVMRLCLSNNTYQVIKTPRSFEPESCGECLLGKSEKGVYYAVLPSRSIYSLQLQVWILDESSGCAKWVLEHDKDIKPLVPCLNEDQQLHGPWIFQDVNYNEEKYMKLYNDGESTVIDEDLEWNSDNDALDIGDTADKGGCNYISILAFHPFKQIVFLSSKLNRGLAYHLSTSKVEVLGNLGPKYYSDIAGPRGLIEASFPYTPCWM